MNLIVAVTALLTVIFVGLALLASFHKSNRAVAAFAVCAGLSFASWWHYGKAERAPPDAAPSSDSS